MRLHSAKSFFFKVNLLEVSPINIRKQNNDSYNSFRSTSPLEGKTVSFSSISSFVVTAVVVTLLLSLLPILMVLSGVVNTTSVFTFFSSRPSWMVDFRRWPLN